MENIIAAILFAVLTAAGTLGVSSIGMFIFHRNADDRDAEQRARFEYGFFGLAGLVVMLLMWYAL
ncbi:hypothetical protein [Pseudidiomarina terrestris]|uniref:Uncharacterized protein n=1 Tax=Pseudidiomarina terrestris TaxID=2820060 RepID=A0AAW7QXQ8_9GAMM|nr:MULTISPECIES: hypothetical protein [unclassified Pseudidiomarina]MDN7123346.1 hypothetical protein [Pseudidiomarina sp. 1APP75-32.1]MDN7127822.1 hypothetical protein [Pseudidiomarina sp. 1APR75-33.1]MDN7128929.1 hypothetical protein [Pseudidiomarina sp. 1APR75-15]MDN7134808.1 hypothetical protein [Pseudidiomarina sp. 1ASP75-5]MDN7137486.1 hypothetical protein [Pseudidiomarina sp. 1ASP75-14]